MSSDNCPTVVMTLLQSVRTNTNISTHNIVFPRENFPLTPQLDGFFKKLKKIFINTYL